MNPADLPVSVRLNSERVVWRSFDEGYGRYGGGNSAVRYDLIKRIGLFDTDMGGGTRLEAGEDWDFFYRAWKAAGKLVCTPTLVVEHDHGRRTQEDELRVRRGYTVGRGAFFAKHILGGDALMARVMYWELDNGFQALLSRTGKFRWRHPVWLLKGFLGYCWVRVRRAFRPSPKDQGSANSEC